MRKWRFTLYTEELYAEVLIKAPTKEEAYNKVSDMTGEEIADLDWRVSDGATPQDWDDVSICDLDEVDEVK